MCVCVCVCVRERERERERERGIKMSFMGLTEYSISIGSQIHFNHYSAEERCKTPQSTPLSQVFKL